MKRSETVRLLGKPHRQPQVAERTSLEPKVAALARQATTLLLLVALGSLAGACSAPVNHDFPTIAKRLAQGQTPTLYQLQAGDLLNIKFYHNPELDQEVVIRPDGMISLPVVDEVKAAGLTPGALDAELTRRYTGELARPDITVIVREFAGQRVYVGGEVGQQGVVELSGGLTLFQAIQEAGGLLPTAKRNQVILIRRDPEGKPVGQAIDIRPIQSGEHPEQDIPLAPHDVVVVSRSKIANMGLFVEQYMRDLLPVMPYFGFTTF